MNRQDDQLRPESSCVRTLISVDPKPFREIRYRFLVIHSSFFDLIETGKIIYFTTRTRSIDWKVLGYGSERKPGHGIWVRQDPISLLLRVLRPSFRRRVRVYGDSLYLLSSYLGRFPCVCPVCLSRLESG